MMTKCITVIVMLSLLVNMPKAVSAMGNGLSAPTNIAVQQQTETRVYIRRQCILGEERDRGSREFFGAIAAIFLPLLINKAIGGVSSALKKAGSEEELKDSGRLPTYLYQITKTVKEEQRQRDSKAVKVEEMNLTLNPDLGCVIIVRGLFDKPDEAGEQSKVSFPNTGILLAADDEDKRRSRLNASGIPVSKIALVYEAAIKVSNDKTALYYEGRFLTVNSFQGTRSSDSRALVFSIAINGAGAKDGEPTLSLSLSYLGEIKKGMVMGPQQLGGRRSSWLGGLGLSEDALKVIEKIKLDNDQPVNVMPVTIEGTIVETEKGSKALRFIAEVLDATKEDVSKTVSGEILKDREKEAATAAEAREKSRQDEEAAYAAYLSAKADLSKLENPTADERAAKEFEVERAKRSWCIKLKALRAIGESPSGTRPDCN